MAEESPNTQSLTAGSRESLSVAKPKTRQRASQACLDCRARKVRCDFTQHYPCSNCASAGKTCQAAVPPPNKRKSSQNALLQHAPTPSQAVAATPVYTHSTVTVDTLAGPHGASISPAAQSHKSVPSPMDGGPIPQRADTGASNLDRVIPDSARDSLEPARTVDDDIWARNLQSMSSAEAAASGTEISPEVSVTTPQSSGPPRKRMKFGDEPLAHSMLPHMNGHAELLVNLDHQTDPEVNRLSLQSLLPPRAIHPFGKAPWINADCQGHLGLLAHLAAEDRYYLYNMKKVFQFPQRSVTCALVVTFFESVFPLFPIVDRCETAELFDKLYSHQQSSPLLFHSLLFIACQYVDEQVLHNAGFRTTSEAKIYFFQRAKLLYTHNCEPDHLVVLQSLIMLSYWWMDYTEEKDMRYWLSCAVNLALTMGMHRTVPKSLNMSPARTALWRRIFWSLFGREHNVSVALGQPFQIRLVDCDLSPFCEADFEEDHNVDVVPADLRTRLSGAQCPCHIHVTLKHVELACWVEKLLRALNEARSHHEVIAILDSMKEIASPQRFLLPVSALDGLSIEDATTWTKRNIFTVFHFLNHERIATLYYRRYEKAYVALQRTNSDAAEGPRHHSFPTTQPFHGQHIDIESKLREVRANIFLSADRVFQMVEKLRSRGLLRYVPSFVTTTTFHALLSLADEIISSVAASPRCQQAKEKFYKVLAAVGEMRKYWSSAQWSYLMYSNLAQNDFKALRDSREKAKRNVQSLQPHSQLASRNGTPANANSIGPPGFPFGINHFDPMLYATDSVPFWIDSYDDVQNLEDGNQWAL